MSSVGELNKFTEFDVAYCYCIFNSISLVLQIDKKTTYNEDCVVVGQQRSFRVNSKYARHGHCSDRHFSLSASSVTSLF